MVMKASDVEGVEDGAAGGYVAQGLIQVHGTTGVVGVETRGAAGAAPGARPPSHRRAGDSPAA